MIERAVEGTERGSVDGRLIENRFGNRFEREYNKDMFRYRPLTVEKLEARQLFAAVEPTAEEQLMLELINRARLDPIGEVQRNAAVNDLNQGLAAGAITTDPKMPLAFNPQLYAAAESHNEWMFSTGNFSHTGQNGTSPTDRALAAQYAPANTFDVFENLAFAGTSQTPNVPSLIQRDHDDLFEDPSHRLTLMDPTHREVGIAVGVGRFLNRNGVLTTHLFGLRNNRSFLTGVIYSDGVTADRFYTIGEGLGGVTVSVKRPSDGAQSATTSFASGGYQIELEPGVYEVQFTGAGLGEGVTQLVTIGAQNVKLDLNTSQIGTLSLSIENAVIPEAGGQTTATVTRSGSDMSAPLTVTLLNSRVSDATVPASLVIEANQASATFTVGAVDDMLVELTQVSRITVTAPSFRQASKDVSIVDNDAPSIWQNQALPADVDNDGTVSPVDVLLVINRLSRTGTGLAPNTQVVPARYFDVDGDWFIAPLDVLVVINALNRRQTAGEGEKQASSSTAREPAFEKYGLDMDTPDGFDRRRATGVSTVTRRRF